MSGRSPARAWSASRRVVGHERPRDDDPGRARGECGTREGGRERLAVLAAAQDAERQAAVGEAQLAAAGHEVPARRALGRAAVEVARVADHRGDVGGQVVLGDNVEDVRVAVDPDGVVVLAQDREGAGPGELGPRLLRRVEHVAQAEHQAGAHGAQHAEAVGELAVDTEGEAVDDEDLGAEGREGVAQGAGAEANRAGHVEPGVGAAAIAVEVGGRGGQRQRVGPGGELEQGRLRAPATSRIDDGRSAAIAWAIAMLRRTWPTPCSS